MEEKQLSENNSIKNALELCWWTRPSRPLTIKESSSRWSEYSQVIYYMTGIVMGSSVEMGWAANRHTTKNAKLVLKSSRHCHVSRNLLLIPEQISKRIKDKKRKGKGKNVVQCFFDLYLKGRTDWRKTCTLFPGCWRDVCISEVQLSCYLLSPQDPPSFPTRQMYLI